MSNYASPPQLVENVPYKSLEQMHGFATRWRDEHRGQWFTAGKLSGFCLLMKRSLYHAIGGLDERFGLGLFDDDDLAIRARQAGFELAVAHDLFIHHFGSRTFAGNGIDAERLLSENGRKFAEKWGLSSGEWQVAGGEQEVAGGYGRAVPLKPWTSDRRGSPDPAVSRTGGLPSGPEMETCGQPSGKVGRPCHNVVSQWLKNHRRRQRPRLRLTMIVREKRGNFRNASHPWPACSTRSWWSTPAPRTGRGRLPRSLVRGCLISSGSMTSPRPATRRWQGPPEITPSGSTPMM